jgi:RNA polymerase sigma-70 factor (ECF subfamily)
VTEQSQSPAPRDRELADRVLVDGDETAFRMLYRRHTPALYQLVLRILGGNQPDAEDVVQEVWIRAVEGLGQFRWG